MLGNWVFNCLIVFCPSDDIIKSKFIRYRLAWFKGRGNILRFLIVPLQHYEFNVVSFELVSSSVTLLMCFRLWEPSVLTAASLQTLLTALLPSIHSLSLFSWNRATATVLHCCWGLFCLLYYMARIASSQGTVPWQYGFYFVSFCKSFELCLVVIYFCCCC